MDKQQFDKMVNTLWEGLLKNPSFHFDAQKGEEEFDALVKRSCVEAGIEVKE